MMTGTRFFYPLYISNWLWFHVTVSDDAAESIISVLTWNGLLTFYIASRYITWQCDFDIRVVTSHNQRRYLKWKLLHIDSMAYILCTFVMNITTLRFFYCTALLWKHWKRYSIPMGLLKKSAVRTPGGAPVPLSNYRTVRCRDRLHLSWPYNFCRYDKLNIRRTSVWYI